MQTRFAHVRNSVRSYTIAFTEIPRGATGTVHFSVAYCSPRDNFCKRTGRNVAEGRLSNGKYDSVHVNSSRFGDIVEKIIEKINSSEHMPKPYCFNS